MRPRNGAPWRDVKVSSSGRLRPDGSVRPPESGIFGVVLKYVKLYCKYSSLVGFKYLAEDRTTWIERILWCIVYIITLCSLIIIVRGIYQTFLDAPIATMVDADYFPTNNLEFPGVAICTINRISRQSAMKMATEIFRANVSELPVEEIYKLVLQLGDLYDSAFQLENRHAEAHELLSKFYNGVYDVTDIMKRLSPECSIVLMRCFFHGEMRNCSDIFAFRKTQDGYCCTFNYAREEDDIPLYNQGVEKPLDVFRVEDLGIERGLTVVMDPQLDDYLYTTLPVVGWKVTVFKPRDYPDVTSGGVSEVLVSPLSERYVELDAISFYSTKQVLSYPVKQRGCMFPNEQWKIRAGYTYSDCVVTCKIDDIWRNCKCRPFFYPRRGKKDYSKRICDIADVPCLAYYKSKWLSVVSYAEPETSRTENETWALRCYDCYPSCDDVNYVVRSTVSYIEPGSYKTSLLNGFDIVDQSILHVYFTKLGTIKLKQDVIYRWYEMLSNIGGIGGVFVGFSLISVVELAYFAVLMVLELCTGQVYPEEHRNEESSRTESPPMIQAIYWSELFPRSRPRLKADELPRN